MNSMHLAQRAAWRHLFLVGAWLLLAVLPAAAQDRGERVTGDWQQFIYSDGTWRSLGLYRVEPSGDGYRMEAIDQVRQHDVVPSRGLSDIRFTETEWRFNSDWGSGKVGEFRLRRAGPGLYLGWSYLHEEKVNLNMWLLVR